MTGTNKTAKGIGDLTSQKQGTAARFNAGKPQLEYIPAHVLCDYLAVSPQSEVAGALNTMVALADFEIRKIGPEGILLTIPEEHRFAGTCAQFAYGAKKYAPWNWAKGMAWSAVIASMKRHLLAIAHGESLDDESGVNHWGGVGCNAVMLTHYYTYYPQGDDRPPLYIFGRGVKNVEK